MNRCRRYLDLIEDALADEIPSGDRADLEEHCAACPACADLLKTHQTLLALGDEIPMPEKSELREMRTAVLAAIDRPERRSGFLADLGNLWRAHPLPSGLATAAVLVCTVFLGWWSPQTRSLEDQLLRQSTGWIGPQTADFDDAWDRPFSFANVSVRRRGAGQLALSFDASRHVDLQVSQDSPLAREVLLHAILEPSSLGSRLRAMDVTPQIGDDRLRDALIATMLDDPDPTVRINALAVLARYPYDQRCEDALIQILSQDQDVQMRLAALEELARRDVGMDTIRGAVGENDPNGTLNLLREATMEF